MTIIIDILISIVLLPVTIGRWLKKVFQKNKILSKISDGWFWVCIKVYHFFRYVFVCLGLPFQALGNFYQKMLVYQEKSQARKFAQIDARERKRQAKRAKRKKNKPDKEQPVIKRELTEEEKKLRGVHLSDVLKPTEEPPKEEPKVQPPVKKEATNQDDFLYISEDFEKKTFGDRISDGIEFIVNIPKKQIQNIKKSIENSAAKKAKNKNDVNRQALMLDFEGADAEKEEKKVMWEYVCKTPEGKVVKGYFAAYSRLEVHSFLMSENMVVYSIRTNKWIQTMYSSVNGNGAKIKRKDLIFFLTQLSTYIKSGIPLVGAMNILTRQFKNKNYQRMFRSMMYDLTMGDNFSKAMENQGNSFPPILINMVKSSELTGELPEALDDMAAYFSQAEAAHKEMVSAMTYPCIVFIMAIGVTVFMMVYIVPQFVEIYSSMDASKIPKFTLIVMAVSDFLKKNLLFIIVAIVVTIVTIIYCYKNIKILRTFMQWIAMHVPVLGNIIIYNEVNMFSKTFSSLLSHNVFITDSMNILKKITNNEIYKMMILETVSNLASGEKISTAFKDHWAFPIPAYEMIVTGEKTGQLAEMMSKVSNYYQDEHKNAVTRVKSLMEPLIIVFLTVIVGVIVLAIVVPMFSMYESVQSMGG